MKLKDWLKVNRKFFLERDLRYLMRNLYPQVPSFYFELDSCLDGDKLAYLDRVKSLYIKGMPLAYILGKEEFFGLEFIISQDCFIPRKETELIVEKAIKLIKEHSFKYILDLGCGCANIAISIKKNVESEDVIIFASDISYKALCIAKKNLSLHSLDIPLIRADLLTGFKKASLDMIVANPPYVEERYIYGSLLYEPRIALQASERGLFFIKKILLEAHYYLKEKGYLILEIASYHKDYLEKFVVNLKTYQFVEWIKDYSNLFRGLILRVRKYG